MIGEAGRWTPARRVSRLVLAVATLIATTLTLTACTTGPRVASVSQKASSTATAPAPARTLRPADMKGELLSHARSLLEADGWKVKAVGTKNRSIRRSAEYGWQVTKVKTGKNGTVTLTAGKLTTKTVAIEYKTKTVKLPDEPKTYKEVAQKGVNGERVITYLDGKKIQSTVTRAPVTKIVEIGTRRPYTGKCTIWGSYANRYVKCTGFYNPEAKRAAQELASLCNSTTSPLADCRGVYGSYFR